MDEPKAEQDEARAAVQRSLDWQDNGGPHTQSRT
jgi:hypothetical protein